MKTVIISPLPDLAGFYDPPYGIETETAIELQIDDDGAILTRHDRPEYSISRATQRFIQRPIWERFYRY